MVAQVSLGRLGIITKVTLPIVRQPVYDRTYHGPDTQQLQAYYWDIQNRYNALEAAVRDGMPGAQAELDAFLLTLDERVVCASCMDPLAPVAPMGDSCMQEPPHDNRRPNIVCGDVYLLGRCNGFALVQEGWTASTGQGHRTEYTLNETAMPVYGHVYQPVKGGPMAGFDAQGRYAVNTAFLEQAK